ncbi:MAG: UDP-3-O-(3-hydroxymyristoyl)glucosamine N-acyltransferase [Alphaproteobacteria bacterium]|nr:UDP-3-O-(3-hydroxymyristoyl)glucosamine N-acyltransferase [Alphaproteobacteria bacterium]
MADPRFFNRQGPITLGELARISSAELAPGCDAEQLVHDVAPLDTAGADELSFLDNPKYADAFRSSNAGACVVAAKLAGDAPAGMAVLLSDRPYRAYALIARAFYPGASADTASRHPSAIIDTTASIGEGCAIGAGAIIAAGVVLGDRVRVGAGAVIETAVTVGVESEIGAATTLSHCDIGARCMLHPGVRIGQRGFGFDMSPEGHLDVPQLGRVIIGDDVEIGANSCIDRGAGPDTIIGEGCKIDNLVQIGHNVQMGKGCVVVAQAGIAGSAQLGDFVVLAGQAGIAGHVRVAAGTQIAARSGAMRDTDPGDKLAGNPAIPAREYFRQMATLAKLTKDKNSS